MAFDPGTTSLAPWWRPGVPLWWSMASEPIRGFGGVWKPSRCVVLASVCFGGGLSHGFNQSACMHGSGDDGSGGDEPEQPRQTTEEENAAGKEQGPEGKAGGACEGRNRVVPRRHKSISIDMFVFIFHGGYSFLGFPWLSYVLNIAKLLSRKDLDASHIWIDLSCLLVRTYEYLSTDSFRGSHLVKPTSAVATICVTLQVLDCIKWMSGYNDWQCLTVLMIE